MKVLKTENVNCFAATIIWVVFFICFSQNLPKGENVSSLFFDWHQFCKTNNSSNIVM